MTFALTQRQTFEANLLRAKGAPFVLDGADLRNQFHVHVVNKSSSERTFRLEPVALEGATFLVPQPEVVLGGGASADVPVFVTMPLTAYRPGSIVTVSVRSADDAKAATAQVLGPSRLRPVGR